MSKYAFLVTSAINTKFGVYNKHERLGQTLGTMVSVRKHVPDAKLFVLEMAGVQIDEEQKEILRAVPHKLLDFTTDPAVVGLYNSTDNWDVVKSVTEVMCFIKTLTQLYHNTNELDGVERIFKISGRYELTDNFKEELYGLYSTKPYIVIGANRASQFPFSTTQVSRQYMSRLWSWPKDLTPEVIQAYEQGLEYMYERLAAGGYCDIEHMLYKFLPKEKVMEVPILGLKGNIAPNGVPIED